MSKLSLEKSSNFRLIAALVLCSWFSTQPLFAQESHAEPVPAKANSSKLDPDQRILLLLNRFTFGPTSDEVASMRNLVSTKNSHSSLNAVIDRWFEQQLHPDSLPSTPGDQELAARLAEFPAMQLPVDQLLDRFPSGAEIRQAANGRRPIPTDPTLAAIYRRHIDLYREKQIEKQEAQTKPATEAMTPLSAAPAPTPPMESTEPAYAESLVKTILALPPADRIDRILAMQPDEYEMLRSHLKGPQKQRLIEDLTPSQRELISDFDNPTRTIVQELQAQRLLRDVLSSHQLQEVMTTFWLNHFNVYLHKDGEMPYYLVSYERDVLRPRALGNFEDLLVATAESPAMLLYLDNSSSTGPDSVVAERQKRRALLNKGAKSGKALSSGLNENYARELMELHTLGVDGGYTQKDITEVARVFSGWTVDHPGQGGNFFFDEARHDPGTKLVLGHKIKENGQQEGLELLHILATSPATAHFISQELAIAFVSDTPPPAMVRTMAKTFLRTHGDIASVLLSMIHSPEFWSTQTYRAKVKTPLEYVVSAARVGDAEITNTQPLVKALNQMGMPLYGCVPPTGYAAKADAWVSTGALVTRMNFGLQLGANRFPGIRSNWSGASQSLWQDHSAQQPPVDPLHEAEQRLEARLIPTGISSNTRAAILNQAQDQTQAQPSAPIKSPSSLPISANPSNPRAGAKKAAVQASGMDKQAALLAGLLLGSPEFQRK